MAKSGMAGSGMADRDAGRVRLVGLGTGQMGGGMGRLVLRRSGLTLVGAHARRAERAGQELGSAIGEAILLGRETIARRPWPGTAQDAFVLHAEVLELKRKPSVPIGALGEDAFGGKPRFEELGERLRALLNVGREDVEHAGLTPLDGRVSVVGASSGYLVVDVTDAAGDIRVGDLLSFGLTYGALLRAMTSEYVEKRLLPASADEAGGKDSTPTGGCGTP